MGRGHIREAVIQAPPILTCHQAPTATSEKPRDTPLRATALGVQKGSPPLTSLLVLLKPPMKDTVVLSGSITDKKETFSGVENG